MTPLTVAVACGGTGGHIYPALAVAESLRNAGCEIYFVGSDSRMEKDKIPAAGYRFYGLPIRPLSKKQPWHSLRNLWQSTRQALAILKEQRPAVLVGMGCYITVPTVIAAWWLKIPIVLIETNLVIGKANQWLARMSTLVAMAYAETARYIPHTQTCVTGSPIRPGFKQVARDTGARQQGLNPTLKTLLIVGGSQGAQKINNQIIAHLPQWLELSELQIVHICGESHMDSLMPLTESFRATGRYHLRGYVQDMPSLLACTDLAVSRAGASMIAELLACRIPSVLIPGEFGGAHQRPNAEVVQQAGAGLLLTEQELTNGSLCHIVRDVILDTERCHQMQQNCSKLNQPDAAYKIAQIILKITQRQGNEAVVC